MMTHSSVSPSSRSPEHQLALQLFSDLSPQNKTIAESDTDVGFSINQVLVDVKDLSMLARRTLIGCYFLAATSPGNKTGAYDFDLGFFKWLINYSSSNNITHLKKVFREAQKSAIEANLLDPENPSKDKWASVPLMGVVTIQGGRIAYKLPVELVAGMTNPAGIMMYLSLKIQANFTSIYAQTLFAKVVPLKQQGATPWMTLLEFTAMMNIEQFVWKNEFRYLNRDVIKVAVGQINEHSDLRLTLETKNEHGSRRIEYLRFVIEQKPVNDTWTNTVNSVVSEREIYEVLTLEFGMAPKDLDKVKARRDVWTNAKILEAIEYTRTRMSNTKLDFLRRPGNYFVDALENGYKIITAAQKQAEVSDVQFEQERRAKIQQDGKVRSKEQAKEVKGVMDEFAALPDALQDELWRKYLKSPAKVFISSVEKVENGGEPMDRGSLLSKPRIRTGFESAVKRYLDSVSETGDKNE